MAKASGVDFLRQATETRDLAKRTKRLAEVAISPDDKERLLRHVDQLEAQASRLERRAYDVLHAAGGMA